MGSACDRPEVTDRPERTGQADLLLVNGNLVTMDPERPTAEALAIADGRIVAVGSTAEIRDAYAGSEIVDLDGRTAMPGIIDAHGHLLSLGTSLMRLNLRGVQTPDEAVERVRARAATTAPGDWITGWGWDEGAWADRYPTRELLDRAAPQNPVFLMGLHSFASWANSAALRAAGITADTPDPPNGAIVRDPETREPTGVLMNAAQDLLTRAVPPLTAVQRERAIRRAVQECLKHGLTTVHDANVTAEALTALEALQQRGELGLRVYAMLDGTDGDLLDRFFASGPVIESDGRLTVRSVKLFADGALGSRGAALFEPYSDAPTTRGQLRVDEDSLYRTTLRALRAGYQVATHAIGDRANHVVLNAYERALREASGAEDPRLRIEHAQVVASDDLPRFAVLGVIASMQPPHATSDMPWAADRLGPDRIRGAYAWRDFLRSGAHVPMSSDFPGESLDPFRGIYAAVTRQSPEGIPEGGWYPEQRVSRREALRAYTREPAFAGFEEELKGRIAPGLLADLIVLSVDITEIPADQLLGLQVLATYVGGTLVYEAPSGP